MSGPSISMASPMRSAAHRPNAFGSSRRWSGARYSLVFGTLCAPGTSGSNCALSVGRPVIDSAPCVVPWYAIDREITLYLFGLPVSLK